MSSEYRGKSVAILGYGIEGKAAYDYWSKLGADITIHDANEQLKAPKGVKTILGRDSLKNLDNYDLVVRSPGVLPHLFKTKAPVTTVVNEFMDKCPGTAIGVTGTKGKGTTASLIHHILKKAGMQSFLGGNIGEPPLALLDKMTPDSYAVVELSNLQLWDIKSSPQIAVLLMIAPEHMDWHRGSMDEYVATKANITRYQNRDDLLVFHGANEYTAKIAQQSAANKMPYYIQVPSEKNFEQKSVRVDSDDNIKVAETVICNVSDVTLPGRHNLENVCAAIGAVFGIVKDPQIIRQAIKSYQGLPHRLEFVAEAGGVKYYDDSIATIEEAAVAAIKTFDEPKVLILGGSDKGLGFDKLAETVTNSDVSGVILIGETAPKIQGALEGAGFEQNKIVSGLSKMSDIVQKASQLAKPGDVVLLSPACASFGLFKNYADRGDQFKQTVKSL